ncbi:uncharacterized protein LOC120337369 [Styela clava]
MGHLRSRHGTTDELLIKHTPHKIKKYNGNCKLLKEWSSIEGFHRANEDLENIISFEKIKKNNSKNLHFFKVPHSIVIENNLIKMKCTISSIVRRISMIILVFAISASFIPVVVGLRRWKLARG